MADHYSAAIDRLADVSLYTDELDMAYTAHAEPKVIASLHQKIGRELKLAHIHAQLAQVGALEDVARSIDEAAQPLEVRVRGHVCSCGSPDTAPGHPAETIVHRYNGEPCYIETRPVP